MEKVGQHMNKLEQNMTFKDLPPHWKQDVKDMKAAEKKMEVAEKKMEKDMPAMPKPAHFIALLDIEVD